MLPLTQAQPDDQSFCPATDAAPRAILVVALLPSDASRVASLLASSNIEAQVCPITEVAGQILAQQAAAVIIEEDALSPAAVAELGQAVAAQPWWSDFPFIILTRHLNHLEQERAVSLRLEQERTPLRHCLHVEQQAQGATLVAAARGALRHRSQQYLLRDHGDALELAQRALIENEKLAEVGRLTAAISHEINNPLESVTNLLYLISMDESLRLQTQSYVTLASSELARVTRIAGQTLRFHRQALRPRTVTSEELLEPVLTLYERRLMHERVDLEVDAGAGHSITCFEGDIRQVLSNLVSNAVDAMHGGGRLRIRARCATDWRTGARGARITVADTGAGMSSAVAKRIFEAFYTTKGMLGSGLGLWISHQIVQKHGGRLRVRSRNQRPSGTAFSLFLPEQREGVE